MFVVFELVDGLDIETLYRQKRTSKGLYKPPLDLVLRSILTLPYSAIHFTTHYTSYKPLLDLVLRSVLNPTP
jgi:hypothetical protein